MITVLVAFPTAMPTVIAAAKQISANEVAITREGIVEHSFAQSNRSVEHALYRLPVRWKARCQKKFHRVETPLILNTLSYVHSTTTPSFAPSLGFLAQRDTDPSGGLID